MTLHNIYIIPHGDELIELPNQDSRIMSRKIEEVAVTDNSDVKVILSPHGVRLSKSIGIISTEYFHEYLKLSNRVFRGRLRNERKLAKQIASNCDGLTEEINFITSEGEKSIFPLDFGTVIPLSFFSHSSVVSIGQPRFDDHELLIQFGKSLFETVVSYEKSVSVIFSADQAHTHSRDGPYGYSPEAAEYDRTVIESIRKNDFSPLMLLSDEFIQRSKPDSFWNMLILNGMLTSAKRKMIFDYYYVERYFGMMFAHSYI